MKTVAKWIVVLALLAAPHLSALALADEHPPEAQAAYAEMKSLFGVVPTFMKSFPEEAVAAAWEEMKGVQLADGAVGGKTKELIGLAVASQIPCRYCIYFHTAAARLHGASDREIKEAVVMAALTRHWSTFLNGTQADDATFRAELAKAFTYAKQPHAPAAPAAVTDAASAYQDIERTLGAVPTFFRQFPEGGIAGAWREYKGVELNPATALPGKTKELIGLAVASQIPCHYCIHAHTEAARQLYGASDVELRESVAMAAMTRFWSTFLNGAMVDEVTFRKETDQIVKLIKSKTASR